MRSRLGRPSPALVIACISLFVALGGVGYAAATGSIDGREIKNNSVASKDIKNSSVAGTDVKTSGLTGSDVKADSLTGSDIAETGLGKVPSASQADSAATAGSANTANSANSAGSVGGLTLRKVNYRSTNAAATTIFNEGGLQINAACAAGGALTLNARTTKQDSSIYSHFDDLESTGDLFDEDLESGQFDTATIFDLEAGQGGANAGTDDPGLLHFQFDALDGTVVTGTLATDEAAPGSNCRVSGNVIVG